MKLRTLFAGLVAAVFTTVAVAAISLPGVNSTINTVFTYAFEMSTDKPTYSATTGAFTPVAAAGDICALQGSATKLIRVRRVLLSGIATTAALEPIEMIFRTATYSSGTGTQAAVVKQASTSAAATAVLEFWTANPTVGAGTVLVQTLTPWPLATGATATNYPFAYEPGRYGQPTILQGTAQWLAVNLATTFAVAGPTAYCTFEWTEE